MFASARRYGVVESNFLKRVIVSHIANQSFKAVSLVTRIDTAPCKLTQSSLIQRLPETLTSSGLDFRNLTGSPLRPLVAVLLPS